MSLFPPVLESNVLWNYKAPTSLSRVSSSPDLALAWVSSLPPIDLPPMNTRGTCKDKLELNREWAHVFGAILKSTSLSPNFEWSLIVCFYCAYINPCLTKRDYPPSTNFPCCPQPPPPPPKKPWPKPSRLSRVHPLQSFWWNKKLG